MTPPISIDGTDITGATIDGTDVTEITVDGDTVFTAGPAAGEYFYVADTSGQVRQWELTTPFDLNTATNQFTFQTGGDNEAGFGMSPDGTRFYYTCASPEQIQHYNLSTPFDLQSATPQSTRSLSVSQDFAITPDGTMGYVPQRPGEITTFDMSADPYDTDAASVSTTSASTFGRSLQFADNGNKMYGHGSFGSSTSNDMNEYNLSAPYDPFSRSGIVNTLSESYNQLGCAFNDTGDLFVQSGYGENFVEVYSTSNFSLASPTSQFTFSTGLGNGQDCAFSGI